MILKSCLFPESIRFGNFTLRLCFPLDIKSVLIMKGYFLVQFWYLLNSALNKIVKTMCKAFFLSAPLFIFNFDLNPFVSLSPPAHFGSLSPWGLSLWLVGLWKHSPFSKTKHSLEQKVLYANAPSVNWLGYSEKSKCPLSTRHLQLAPRKAEVTQC